MNNKIKGYKASYNGVCRGHKYEVGQTYTVDDICMCERGFHFCVNMKDVIGYYLYNEKFVLFEVNGSGEIIMEEDKTVCSQIEIIRIVPQEEYTFSLPLYEYDEKGNLIHFKNSFGYKFWRKYDENNKLIHHKDSTGFESWKTFDENNNLIHFKNSTGYERSYYPLTTN